MPVYLARTKPDERGGKSRPDTQSKLGTRPAWVWAEWEGGVRRCSDWPNFNKTKMFRMSRTLHMFSNVDYRYSTKTR